MLDELADQFEQASEAYATRFGIARDPDWYVIKLQEELGELSQAWIRLTGRARPRSACEGELAQDLANETADLLGHVLLFARRNRVDLASAIERKWRFSPVCD